MTESKSTTPNSKLRLLKFGAQWCGPCRAMAKAQTLEKFAAAHPEIEIQVIDLPGDDDKPEAFAGAEDLADEHDVESLPTIIVLDSDGDELARASEATNLRGLEKLYNAALLEKSKRKLAGVKG